MAWVKAILLTLAVTLSAVLTFPTAQYDQIMVHHTPMHDVVYIPDYMMAELPYHHHPQHHNQHSHHMQQGLVHIDGLGLAQIQPEHHTEEVEHQFEPQPQHILLNPNHAVYVSTQDEFGNLRTFKISQNSPLLQQHMLTGQEILAKPAKNADVKKGEEKIVEEIVNIEEAGEVLNKTSSVEEKEDKNIAEIIETPQETQIENPEVVEEKAQDDKTEEIPEEESPKEKVNEEEQVIIVLPTNIEEVVVVEEKKDVVAEKDVDLHDLLTEINDDLDEETKEVHNIARRDVSAQLETLDDIEKEDEASEHVSEETETLKKDLSETKDDKPTSSEEKFLKSQIESVDFTNVQKIAHAISSSTEKNISRNLEIIEPLTPKPPSSIEFSEESVEETSTENQEATEEPTATTNEPNVPIANDDNVDKFKVPENSSGDFVKSKEALSSKEDIAESKVPVTSQEDSEESKLHLPISEHIVALKLPASSEEEILESRLPESIKDVIESNAPQKSVEDFGEDSSSEEKVTLLDKSNEEKDLSKETEETITPASTVTPAPSVETVAPIPQEVLLSTTPLPKIMTSESTESSEQ